MVELMEGSMRILCVDDDPKARKEIEKAVNEASPGAEVLMFEKQAHLVKEAGIGGCDVAMLDINMTGLHGLDLGLFLKEISPHTNIIFVTEHPEHALEAMQMHASGYIVKPVTAEKVKKELDELRFPIGKEAKKKDKLLKIQCFGNFDVFTMSGEHVHFERSRGKEVLAYLVHRHGSSCTTKEICAALFEDAPYDKKQQNAIQTIIYSMIRSLKKIGAEAVIERSYNSLAVNIDFLECDYYRFIEVDGNTPNAYQSEYMSQYYWAEFFFDW